ncbi:filamentation induced by cAMP protein fic [Candidatus Magnetomorum sp. HK-1]|nr:filamentation induced by cAMP protein fic [Candidatus Magnetomorum sp. HK-1]
MAVKKISTFKSGNFVFATNYSENELYPLIIELRVLYETLNDLPILPALSDQLESELMRRAIFSTAAIEGNPLKEDDVIELIDKPEKNKLIEIHEIEITNLKDAYDFLKDLHVSASMQPLDVKFIKNIHRLITKNIKHEYNNPGAYRNHIVKVGDKKHGGVYTPPKCLPDIQNLMKEYINWINSEGLLSFEPTIRAALAHYYLGLIHPFADGNGRTARIIEAVLLKLSGIKYIPIMLSNFYYRNLDEYFITFSITRRSKDYDVTPFLKFVLTGCVDSLKDIKKKITFNIRKFTLRDYYDFLKNNRTISSRQNELLISLLEQNEQYSFVLNELFNLSPFRLLYSNVSDRTARRDLKKLKTMNLLSVSENKYFLNWRVL